MNIVPLIFVPAIIGIIIFIIMLFRHPRWAVAGLIIVKPIIDVTWNYHIIMDVNFLRVYACFFAILGLVYILLHASKTWQCPIFIAWIVFLVFNIISIFFILDYFLLERVSYFLRILNGFVAMMLFYSVFDFRRDKKLVIIIFILSALIPMILWIVHIFSAFPNTTVAGISNELTRLKGPYDDFVNFVFYALQMFICAITYRAITHYKPIRDVQAIDTKQTSIGLAGFKKFIHCSWIFVLIALSLLIIYKSYTKGGWLVVPIVSILWFALRKRFIAATIVMILTVAFFSINPFRDEAGSLFRKEIDVLILKNLKWDTDTLLMGRVRDWKGGMDKFSRQSVLNKLLGVRRQLGNPENDYFRILWHNGILGFIAFLFLIGQSAYILLKRYYLYKDPIFLTALLALVMYLLMAIGFYPMFYPAAQWFVWGIVGFVLSMRTNPTHSAWYEKSIPSLGIQDRP